MNLKYLFIFLLSCITTEMQGTRAASIWYTKCEEPFQRHEFHKFMDLFYDLNLIIEKTYDNVCLFPSARCSIPEQIDDINVALRQNHTLEAHKILINMDTVCGDQFKELFSYMVDKMEWYKEMLSFLVNKSECMFYDSMEKCHEIECILKGRLPSFLCQLTDVANFTRFAAKELYHGMVDLTKKDYKPRELPLLSHPRIYDKKGIRTVIDEVRKEIQTFHVMLENGYLQYRKLYAKKMQQNKKE